MPVSTHFSSFTPSTRISSPRLSFTLFGRPVVVTESGKGGGPSGMGLVCLSPQAYVVPVSACPTCSPTTELDLIEYK